MASADGDVDFEVARELGRGAFGVVYLVQNKTCDERYALKTVDLSKSPPDERDKAVEEANLMRNLDHENIVRYVASYVKGKTLFIYTEFCEGGDLADFLEDAKEGSLPETLIVCWVAQVTSALAFMHKKGVLHRDLKPQNIYLTGTADLKLGDLGIARVLESNADMASTMAGTPCYMSPEIFQMIGYNDKTDIWSFGCVVYEMAKMERAFSAPIIQFLVFQVVSGRVPSLPDKYSKKLNKLFGSMLTKNPERRPSAVEILQTDPVREFVENPKKPEDIIRTTGYNTLWGGDKSRHARKLSKMTSSPSPSPLFDVRDVKIPKDSLILHRKKLGRPSPTPSREPVRPGASSEPQSTTGKNLTTIIAKKNPKKDKAKKNVPSFDRKESESTLTGSVAPSVLLSSLMQTLTIDSSPGSPPSPPVDTSGTKTKREAEAAFLIHQISKLQTLIAQGIGQQSLADAYEIMESVQDPQELKLRLVERIGTEKFEQFGHKIMYLRLFEMGLEKVESQFR